MLARALACQADLLAAAAGGRGGLRCGPASNPAWCRALLALEAGQQAEGVRLLANERQHWLARWVTFRMVFKSHGCIIIGGLYFCNSVIGDSLTSQNLVCEVVGHFQK